MSLNKYCIYLSFFLSLSTLDLLYFHISVRLICLLDQVHHFPSQIFLKHTESRANKIDVIFFFDRLRGSEIQFIFLSQSIVFNPWYGLVHFFSSLFSAY
jgi:hypothetical protein